jgi:myo-inositol-1(or 4)-monophosphatase
VPNLVPNSVPNLTPAELELIAIDVAQQAAVRVRAGWGTASSIGTKSSSTDVVTQTDVDTEKLIRALLIEATPECGIVGEEGGTENATKALQWVVDPLDGTVNFLYGVPIFAVSIGAAIDGEFVAGAVVDVLRGETFSASVGNGARLDGEPIRCSQTTAMSKALVVTGFSYTPRLRSMQGEIVRKLLPVARDIRAFGSAALHLCWVACGRVDAYFERDIKIWDWAGGSVIALESGALVDFPCPENDGLVMAASPALAGELRELVTLSAIEL